MATTNISPDAHPESTTVDGSIHNGFTTTDWATLRNRAGDTASDAATTAEAYVTGGGAAGWKGLRRSFFLFNVVLPAGVTIQSAKIRLYLTSVMTGLGNVSLVVCKPSTASNTALAASDFNIAGWNFTTARSSAISTASLSANQYNDWALNATGVADLVAGQVAKFGLVLEQDRANSQPGSNTDNQNSGVIFQTAENSNPPILEVTHSDPAAGETGYSYFMSFLGGMLLLGKQALAGGGPLTFQHVLKCQRVSTFSALKTSAAHS